MGRRATVRRSVLLPGATVGDRATVTDSIVAGSVGRHAEVRGGVIGVDGSVADGESSEAEKRPAP